MPPVAVKTRFAPTPSGYLHLGHIYAARMALDLAASMGGQCLLRLEDIDTGRCRTVYAEALVEDLSWLGFVFDGDVVVQSQRFDLYRQALERLRELGVVYPCFCSRKTIQAELAAAGRAPQGERLDPYPGICRELSHQARCGLMREGRAHSWRLDCRKAASMTGDLAWMDERHGEFLCRPETLGDTILARKDCPTSYHLAVVVDDADQAITHVTRGEDLLQSTHLHRLLQELLGCSVPVWHHHALVRDAEGKRLAKRDKSLSIREMREAGMSCDNILSLIQCWDM